MNRPIRIFIIIAAVALLYLARGFFAGSDTLEYRGEHFKMAKRFWSYEDYKDNPNNLDSNEISHIEAVMRDASIGPNFNSREQFIHAVSSLRFPGYGMEQFGERQQSDGSSLSMFSVEIPQRDEEKYVVARITGDRYTLVDDFVASSLTNRISQVKLESTSLRYYTANGVPVREHKIAR